MTKKSTVQLKKKIEIVRKLNKRKKEKNMEMVRKQKPGNKTKS